MGKETIKERSNRSVHRPEASKQPPLSARHPNDEPPPFARRPIARRDARRRLWFLPAPLVDTAGSQAIRGKGQTDKTMRKGERMRQAAKPVGS